MNAHRGFSLIELIVGIVILGVLMAMAVPRFSDWLRNARIRSSAEAIQNGLQLARAEAVRRNATVRFQLVSAIDDTCALATTGPHWVVSMDNPAGQCATAPSDTAAPRIIQMRNRAEGSQQTQVAAGQSAFVFNGLGRLIPVPAANVAIDVSSTTGGTCVASGGSLRCLRLVVSVGGQIRMCDPALPAGDAQAC
ncbi:MAG: Verru_Chthon cassette protein D [Candidatus Accumulibacter adjunctus]|uniref:Type II secretion system protein H n=1 Tax=Candidatus Accumulibacter adjunctus TaxID=1454001 RepID=A0A011NVT4_9PROT|nr:MAG: Verru_Chthon cassette protein D [Candidatus Accumulibacter adjunctus]